MSSSVIIIDDDKDQASLLSEIIEMSGNKVSVIGKNGKEAAYLFEKHKPDAVFLDISMPDYDGFYALEKIKEVNTEAKIIALAGDLSENTKEKLESYKVTILYKPYEISTVVKIL